MWTNLFTSQSYVGSAEDIKRRLNSYYSISYLKRESSMYICRALLKHGYSSFGLSILEYCSVENLIQREQYYIDTLEPEYNICKTAGSTLGKTHSEEAKGRISSTKKGTNQGKNNSFFGKFHTEESRKKMSGIKLGTTLSDDIKSKVSAGYYKKGKEIHRWTQSKSFCFTTK
jgi:group I intron endonuclease